MDQYKLLKSLSKMKSMHVIHKLSTDQLMFVSQVFLHFLIGQFPVSNLYRNRMKSFAPVIRKFGKARTIKTVKKISKSIPMIKNPEVVRVKQARFAPTKKNEILSTTVEKKYQAFCKKGIIQGNMILPYGYKFDLPRMKKIDCGELDSFDVRKPKNIFFHE